ncbi:SDR family NAD(P)-dependent oxidoreductase [Falsiruegeria mediterranea]|uniref:Dihydroanticapsin 7-dehydrogenase n=1 Tax=Falsiruegeria mediterranea M17 TaxID=1200281 RepID=A0A2R8C9X9_9RHOB|nr:SDR family oxidoreductase [Falsiruegeria mediterranea]SPJ29215.1 Dihydroanticapsin 7-dehydrogenase [Falsiruegeria mediterranea M17]
MPNLKDKVAIVTGAAAARGIGFNAAKVLAGYGATIVLADLTQDDLVEGDTPELEKRAQELRAIGVKSAWCNLDVTDEDDIADCAAFAIETFGGVDILFNNAGVTVGYGPILETEKRFWDLQFAVHVTGPVLLAKAVIPSMRQRGGGSIINNSSIWALNAHEGAAIYGATKLAITNASKVIAIEHGPDNIRCNAIAAGPIRTDMQDRRVKRESELYGITEDEARATLAEPLALKRVGEPHEYGEVVAFLASDMSSFVTGTTIQMDGGEQGGL